MKIFQDLKQCPVCKTQLQEPGSIMEISLTVSPLCRLIVFYPSFPTSEYSRSFFFTFFFFFKNRITKSDCMKLLSIAIQHPGVLANALMQGCDLMKTQAELRRHSARRLYALYRTNLHMQEEYQKLKKFANAVEDQNKARRANIEEEALKAERPEAGA